LTWAIRFSAATFVAPYWDMVAPYLEFITIRSSCCCSFFVAPYSDSMGLLIVVNSKYGTIPIPSREIRSCGKSKSPDQLLINKLYSRTLHVCQGLTFERKAFLLTSFHLRKIICSIIKSTTFICSCC
jgi:hypothetical protein